MTKKQRRDYKAANQRRKAAIIHFAKHSSDPVERSYWAHIGCIQNGNYTK